MARSCDRPHCGSPRGSHPTRYSTAVLLLIAAAAVALLLFLIMKVKLHAFIALVLVSLLTAVVAGIPLGDVPAALLTGFGDHPRRRWPCWSASA